jgi:hypothetical protein
VACKATGSGPNLLANETAGMLWTRRPAMRRSPLPRVLLVIALVAPTRPAWAAFVTFETGQVRPLALSPNKTRLFAVDTPDDRFELFDVTGGELVHLDSVPVGLEPVAVAAGTDAEWVVNRLSRKID